MTTNRITILENKLLEISNKSLEVSNLKADFTSYKTNDIVITAKLNDRLIALEKNTNGEVIKNVNDKIELLNSQLLSILNAQELTRTQITSILTDIAKIKEGLFI